MQKWTTKPECFRTAFRISLRKLCNFWARFRNILRNRRYRRRSTDLEWWACPADRGNRVAGSWLWRRVALFSSAPACSRYPCRTRSRRCENRLWLFGGLCGWYQRRAWTAPALLSYPSSNPHATARWRRCRISTRAPRLSGGLRAWKRLRL